MTTPQQVTERYVTNLLRRGQNNTFRLIEIRMKHAYADELCVGIYYECLLGTQSDVSKKFASGVTPAQSIRRALEKYGVTFR